MSVTIQFVGIDIGDKSYHVSLFNPFDSSSFEFMTDPNPELLIRSLKRRKLDPKSIKVFY